jgi:hypothetical protein
MLPIRTNRNARWPGVCRRAGDHGRESCRHRRQSLPEIAQEKMEEFQLPE